MESRKDLPDAGALLETMRRALAACSDGLDVSAVQPETPLAVLFFDSLMAANFIATLEALLRVSDLPFEQWLAEHSERTDSLTVGSLIGWLLSSLPANADAAPDVCTREASSASPEER